MSLFSFIFASPIAKAKARSLCLAVLLCINSAAAEESKKIVVPPWGNTNNQQNIYLTQLLRLALEKTEAADGHLDIEYYPASFSLTRFMLDLKHNKTIDVIWNGSNPQREEELLAIKIPLLKQFNEYRVLMIRKEDQDKFSKVQNINDLRQFTAGSGTEWPSAVVLRQNDLPVITINNTNLLFAMLKAKRFDYISRNIFEAWDEEALLANDNLAVEKTLLLHGGAHYYYFVNKSNHKLADRIKRGLEIAIADGSYDKLFFSTSGFARGHLEITLGKRHQLELNTNTSIPAKPQNFPGMQ